MRVPFRCWCRRGNSSQVRFLAEIQNINVNVGAMDAKVIINSRTGSVVMNREVILDPCAVAQGNLSVVVDRQTSVSQPTTPFGGGQTVVTPNTQISMQQQGGSLQKINASANLNNVVRALNAGSDANRPDVDSASHAKRRLPARQTGNYLMASDVMAMSGAAYDAQALNGLKRDAAADPQVNLKQVAQQVEGMFVQMMLKACAPRYRRMAYSAATRPGFTPRCTISRLLSRCRKGIRAGRHDGQADEQRQRGPQRNGGHRADGAG